MYCTIPRTLPMPPTDPLWHCGWSPSFCFSWPHAFVAFHAYSERLALASMDTTWGVAGITGMGVVIIITTTTQVVAEVGMAEETAEIVGVEETVAAENK